VFVQHIRSSYTGLADIKEMFKSEALNRKPFIVYRFYEITESAVYVRHFFEWCVCVRAR
jgi:hypothetical protein